MIVDDFGQAHLPAATTVGGTDVRIVSLVPSITELLFELGLAPQIVGRTGFCVHPKPLVKTVSKVGGTKDVDLEKLRALKPTHVIVNVDENTKATFDAITQFVPHVFVTHPLAPADNLRLFRQLGALFGVQPRAELLCDAFSRELEATRQLRGGAAESVLYLIWRGPWMTVSAETYIAQTLALVDWIVPTFTAGTRYPVVDPSAKPRCPPPDRVLLSTEPYAFRDKHLVEAQRVFGAPAHLIDGEYLSWYGSRAIAGLRYLREFAATIRHDHE